MSQIRRVGYILVALLMAATAFSKLWKPPVLPPFVGVASAEIPLNIGGFASPGDYKMDPVVLQALATGDVISREYSDGQTSVDFAMIGGTDRGALHDPRSCLVGAGWSLENDHTEPLPGTNIDVRACHAVGLGSRGYDIVYLYVVNGHIINEPTQIRLSMLVSALLGRRNTPVYFLRFMTPDTTQGGVDPTTHAAMERLAASMWQTLSGRITKA